MIAAAPIVLAKGPLLVFGGPYSNLEATETVLQEAARRGIPADHVICTGDVVAYGADAAATVALIRSAGCHVVMGNCEESLAAGADDCGCGFIEGSDCERLSASWFAHAARQIDADDRRWMAGLPRRIDVAIGGMLFAVIHGGATAINRFIFASSADSIKADELDCLATDGVIAGHCALPFTQSIGGKLWHNAGAIGMPANDSTPRVWFSVLTAGKDGISIDHCAATYDHRTAAEKMRQAHLPEGYAAALETGLWPSCDVLPLREIRERGVPFEQGTVVWQRLENLPRGPQPGRSVQLWPKTNRNSVRPLPRQKFQDPAVTATGEPRATIGLRRLETLWINTGTLCNIACRNCYIESSPLNDRLEYITRAEVARYLDEIARDGWQTGEIGFTGGEPFMNPDLFGIMEDCLARGFRVLVLTNAMRPMRRFDSQLLDLKNRLGDKLTIRVSLDHYSAERHEDERGPGTFEPTLQGLIWLARNGFTIAVAGRTMWGENADAERAGYASLFAKHGIGFDAGDPAQLILFPEMDAHADIPEITTACWSILDKSPADVMCATSRMVVKRKGRVAPAVVACTLLPYDERFELGQTLKDAAGSVPLNHPHCAQFCVLGGASCSAK